MINFMSALYNEQEELIDLIRSVAPFVDGYYFCNDGSTDHTPDILKDYQTAFPDMFHYVTIDHVGLCEIARIKALEMVPDEGWVVMLDADERFGEGVMQAIWEWVKTEESEKYTHVYFKQLEYIDGEHLRTFDKPKLFRKGSVVLPEIIHGDPIFTGDPVSFNWVVLHRRTKAKQIQREMEYLNVYKRLLTEGKIDQGKYEWFVNLHHYVVPHG